MREGRCVTFEVISEDVHGDAVRCSYCERGAPRVVVLPLVTGKLGDPAHVTEDDRWLGMCAYCVLDMARALQKAGDESP